MSGQRPPAVEGRRPLLSEFLHADPDAAVAALERVGGRHAPQLDLSVDHDVAGRVARRFAILRNVLQPPEPADPSVADPLRNALRTPDNEEVRDQLRAGDLDFTPVNKWHVRQLVPRLHAAGVHLPWTYLPMNFDLGSRIAEAHQVARWPFEAFYSQFTDLRDGPEGVEVDIKRIYSLPVSLHGHRTWQEMIVNEMLDPEVALILEANAPAA